MYPEFNAKIGVLPIDYFIDVPCGKCHDCSKNKRRSWIFRLQEELRINPQALFITLTFDEVNYKKFFPNSQYDNKPLSLFLDRFRKKYGRQIRHFFIGELGEDSNRFHYHGIFFGIDYLEVQELNNLWKYGYTWIGYCNEKTISYITKYILKSVDLQYKIPRIMASPGIGSSFVDSTDGKHLFERDKPLTCITAKDHSVPIPRYIQQKGISEKNRRMLYAEYLSSPASLEYVQGIPYKRNSAELSKARYKLQTIRQQQGFTLPQTKTAHSKLINTYGND